MYTYNIRTIFLLKTGRYLIIFAIIHIFINVSKSKTLSFTNNLKNMTSGKIKRDQ